MLSFCSYYSTEDSRTVARPMGLFSPGPDLHEESFLNRKKHKIELDIAKQILK